MSEDKSAEVLDFLRAWRETADGRLGRIEERLAKIEGEIAGIVGYRKQAAQALEQAAKGMAQIRRETEPQ